MAKTRKFLVSLEMHVEAGTPEAAAEDFVRRLRDERSAFQVDVLEDTGEHTWTRLGRKIVRLDELGSGKPG